MWSRLFVAMVLVPGLLVGALVQTARAEEQEGSFEDGTQQELRSPLPQRQHENRQTEKLRLRHELRQQRQLQHRQQHNGSGSLGSPVGPTHGRR